MRSFPLVELVETRVSTGPTEDGFDKLNQRMETDR